MPVSAELETVKGVGEVRASHQLKYESAQFDLAIAAGLAAVPALITGAPLWLVKRV